MLCKLNRGPRFGETYQFPRTQETNALILLGDLIPVEDEPAAAHTAPPPKPVGWSIVRNMYGTLLLQLKRPWGEVCQFPRLPLPMDTVWNAERQCREEVPIDPPLPPELEKQFTQLIEAEVNQNAADQRERRRVEAATNTGRF